jgi:hypothetical protein
MKRIHFQLVDMEGKSITASGGVVHVATADSPAKATLYDADGASLANPVSLTNGSAEFFVADSISTVDLYIQAPGYQFIVKAGVVPANHNFKVDTSELYQIYKIPFASADSTAATEKDTGFNLPAFGQVLPLLGGAGITVTTAATAGAKTIDVGTLSTESGGDANGFLAAVSTAALGKVVGTNGALFVSNAPAITGAATAKSISYTTGAADAGVAGFAILPVILE